MKLIASSAQDTLDILDDLQSLLKWAIENKSGIKINSTDEPHFSILNNAIKSYTEKVKNEISNR